MAHDCVYAGVFYVYFLKHLPAFNTVYIIFILWAAFRFTYHVHFIFEKLLVSFAIINYELCFTHAKH